MSGDQQGPEASRAVQEHCDPEVLALRALGEPAGRPGDDAHLAGCAACRGELESLTLTAGTSRAAGMLELDSPSPRVWQRIQGELDLPADVVPRVTAPSVPAAAPAAPAPTAAPAQAAAPPQADEVGGRSVVGAPGPGWSSRPGETQLPRRHASGSGSRRVRRVAPLLVAAALVGGLLGVGGTVAAQRLTGGSGADAVVAETPLEPLPTWQAGGSAEVVERADGERELRLDVRVDAAPTEDTGFREVWLIDRDVSRLVSLGVLRGDSGTFLLPAGLDLAEYPVVDVSLEPYDGQPAHSGDSIVRGILPT